MSDWTGTGTDSLPTQITKLSDDFEDFCKAQINIFPFLFKNKFGESTYGTGIGTMGILLEVQEQIFDKENKPIISNSQIFIDGDIDVNLNDKIEFNGLTPEILKIAKIPDENGIYTKIIYL